MVARRGRLLVAAIVGLVGFGACSGPASDGASLRFSRTGVSVPWTVSTRHGHPFARTAAGDVEDLVRVDGGERYPKQVVGWRDGTAIRSLLLVPSGAEVDGGGNVTVESVHTPSGHRVVLASVRRDTPDRTVVVRWGDGLDERFTVVESPR